MKTLDDKKAEYEGSKFGKWQIEIVTYTKREDGRNRAVAHCKCDCGTERVVILKDILNGKSTNCGCVKHAKLAEFSRLNAKTHGMSLTKTYATYRAMLDRCNNPNSKHFARYGGRGVLVCDGWVTFEAFLADMGEIPDGFTIERVDNNKGYSKSNCRWATKREQTWNRSTTRYVVFRGETRALPELCHTLDAPYNRVLSRLTRGWDIENALFLPKHSKLKFHGERICNK